MPRYDFSDICSIGSNLPEVNVTDRSPCILPESDFGVHAFYEIHLSILNGSVV